MNLSFSSYEIMKCDLQIKLEQQGCVFNGQELLSNHEESLDKDCSCGRPNNKRPRMNIEIRKCENGWMILHTYANRNETKAWVFNDLQELARWIIANAPT